MPISPICRRARTASRPLLAALSILMMPALAPAQEVAFTWGNPKPQGNPLQGVAFEADGMTGYAIGRHGTCLTTTDAGATWTDRTDFDAFAADLMDLFILGPGELLAVGGPPGIFRSVDGGATWMAIPNPSTARLNEIARVTGSTLSVVGDDGQVLRSTDGGATWQTLNPPALNRDVLDQCWRTPNHGYVIGSLLLRQTTDGGATWTTVPGTDENNFFPGDIQFLDDQNGWICVDFTTYRTTNGGATWFERHGPIGQSPIYQEEAVILDASRRFVVTEAEGAEIWWTQDDGLHWTKLYAREATLGYTDIAGLPDGTVVVVSSDGDLLRSVDQGAAWTNFTRSPGDGNRAEIEALAFLPGGKGIAGGAVRVGGGTLYIESHDGGRSWQALQSPPAVSAPQVIAFRDDLVGLVGGYNGSSVSRTTDGGATWTTHQLAQNYVGSAVDIDFAGATRCYASLYGGNNINYVYASTDAGATWFPASAGIPVTTRLDCVDFLDAMNGYAGGGSSDARIYRTTDGGQGWTQVGGAGLASDMIRDMHWFDEQTGLAGSMSGIFRTTNGGAQWSRVSSASCLQMSFLDGALGYGCSIFDDVVLRTTDGGVTWEAIDLPWAGGIDNVAARPGGFVVTGASSVVLVGESLDPAGLAGGDIRADRPAGMHGDLGPGVTITAAGAVAGRGPVHLAIDATRAGGGPMGRPAGCVVDVEGRRVADLDVRAAGPAAWDAVWDGATSDGTPAPAGVYFLALERGGRRATIKAVRLP